MFRPVIPVGQLDKEACLDGGRKSAWRGYARSGSAGLLGLPKALHRLVFLAAHGYLPEVVMHTCDNPRCVNPYHLVAGTVAANVKDRVKKGRNSKGGFAQTKVESLPPEVREAYLRGYKSGYSAGKKKKASA